MPARATQSGSRPRPQRGLAIAIALIAACGCGYASAQTNHPVTITIVPSTTTPIPSGTCTTQQGYLLCVSEEPIDLTKDVEPVIITWTIASADWAFVKNKGIVIKKGKWKISEKSGVEYAATQKKDGVLYKYAINVTNAAATTTLNWDPTIKNN
jgi:hypothetical protein